MNDHVFELIREIEQLKRQVERLNTISIAGRWQSWTPIVTYSGGATDPNSEAVTAQYNAFGSIVYVSAQIVITRGSSDRTGVSLSMPIERNASGLLTPFNSGGNPTGSYGVLYSYLSPTTGNLGIVFGGTITGTTIYIRTAGFYRV